MVDFSALMSFAGLIALISVIAFIVINFTKARLGKGMQVGANIVVVILFVASVYSTGFLTQWGFGTLAVGQIPPATGIPPQLQTSEVPKPTTADTGEVTKLVGGRVCKIQSDGDNSILIALRNALNTSLGYHSATASAETDPQTATLESATTTAGASLSYTTLNVQPCVEGIIYVLASSGRGTAGTKKSFDSFATKDQFEIETAGQENINVLVKDRNYNDYSTGYTNGTSTSGFTFAVSTTGTSDGNVYAGNTSFDATTTTTYYYDFAVNGSSSIYGTYNANDGIGLSFDSVDASIWGVNALTLQQVDDVSLASYSVCPGTLSANRNAEKCWSMKSLKSGVTYRIKGDLQATNNPTVSGDAPILYVDDKVYFRDSDGKIKYDFYDSSGSNQGMGGLVIAHVVY